MQFTHITTGQSADIEAGLPCFIIKEGYPHPDGTTPVVINFGAGKDDIGATRKEYLKSL
jgi:hypothetical protein